jgi:hypothetical protein
MKYPTFYRTIRIYGRSGFCRAIGEKHDLLFELTALEAYRRKVPNAEIRALDALDQNFAGGAAPALVRWAG